MNKKRELEVYITSIDYGISDLCRIAIIDYVIIHYKSFELILTEDLYRKGLKALYPTAILAFRQP